MTPRPAAFAIPGDITTLTGGYIYERRLLEGLRELGRDVLHIELGPSFADPTPADMAHAVETLAALRVRAPIVAMIHHPLALESGLTDARRDHLFRTERDNLALAAHVLVPSLHTQEILARDYGVAPERITIARPGTDRPTGGRAPTQPPMILSVGIQHPRKGHDVLLKALARLTDLAWRAVIVGSPYDPVHAALLAQLTTDLGLDGRVTFPGRIGAEELDRHYRAATLFALATRYEGYGIVFDEALAYGLPIVSCRTGAVPQTVPPGAGLLVPPDDPAAFADALLRLLSDPALREELSAAATRAGDALPSWADTARTAGAVLDALP
ncbi:MAG: glycosyltransferase family 4 protein, partial [Rhodobacteraceae bacterium]|nr:glycosyltransferase family 4 protein [Paracoccaceae bacterium]